MTISATDGIVVQVQTLARGDGSPQGRMLPGLMAGCTRSGFVHREKVVGGRGFASQDTDGEGAYAAWCRSRRKWKNSTPSRSRRFIICGLRTISPTIEAIFGARK